jgi:hypothetical protein
MFLYLVPSSAAQSVATKVEEHSARLMHGHVPGQSVFTAKVLMIGYLVSCLIRVFLCQDRYLRSNQFEINSAIIG